MNVNIIDINTATNVKILKDKGYKWALIYNLDNVQLLDINNVAFKVEDILEVRIFNENKEIYIYKENELKAIEREESNSDEYIESAYILMKNICSLYKEVKIKKYINYDEDNQAYIEYIRPVSLH